MRILIVEDEDNSRAAMEMYLGATVDDVRSTGTGDEAIDTVASGDFRPDILICDWMLRGNHDGVDVARHVLGACPDVILIFITGQSVEELQRAAADLPVCRFLTKPFGLGSLDDVMQVCLEEHRRRKPASTAH